ncbi:hypothetical protein VCHC32A1_1533, partial [Vibrio cholerae HC-32A1]
MSLIII